MITSRDNETLKLVRKLLSQKKHRDETGLFVAEGEDLVTAAHAAGIDPVHLLVAGETVEPALLAGVSTLPHPARAVAVYRRADLPVEPRSVALGLWGLSDPGNVGTLVRTADAFGACVGLSAGCADPLSPKAVRATVGAIFRVPLLGWDALPRPFVALDAHGGVDIGDAELPAELTLVLGAERAGLPDSIVSSCERRVTIPLPGASESLNVAAAGAIALYAVTARRSR